jgi:hypothetical protein
MRLKSYFLDADIGKILPLISANFKRNTSLVTSSYKVLEFDFFAKEWTQELQEVVARTAFVICADGNLKVTFC